MFHMLSSDVESRTLENPNTPITGETLFDLYGDNQYPVSTDSAMTLAAVYSCVNVLSSSIAQLPLHVMRRKGEDVEKAVKHPLYDLLSNEVNNWESSYDWREQSMYHACMSGNAISWIKRDSSGVVRGIETVNSAKTSLIKNGVRYIYQVVDEDGFIHAVAPEDVIHVKAIGKRSGDFDKWGKSPIAQQKELIGLGLAAQQYGQSFSESGGKPAGIASLKGPINKEGWTRLKTTWASLMGRLRDNTQSRNVLIPAEIDYRPISIAPEDSQFLETMGLNRSQVAGIFNVPAHMINDLGDAAFNNMSEMAISFVRHTITPWVVKWEQELNRKLFTSSERKLGYYVKFDMSALLRGSAVERAEYYHYAITDGWLNRNEVRVMEERNKADGLDEYLIAVNAAQQVDDPKAGDTDKPVTKKDEVKDGS